MNGRDKQMEIEMSGFTRAIIHYPLGVLELRETYLIPEDEVDALEHECLKLGWKIYFVSEKTYFSDEIIKSIKQVYEEYL